MLKKQNNKAELKIDRRRDAIKKKSRRKKARS